MIYVVELIYGRNAITEALRAGRRRLRRLLVARGTHGVEPLASLAQSHRVLVVAVERHDLDRMVGAHHQGVVAEADPFPYARLEDLIDAPTPPLIVALDSLQDPQNFGTLLRTALAVGATGVMIPERRAVAVTAAVSNASAGAVEHLAVARVTNLARALRELKERRIWVYGLTVDAKQPYWEADLSGPAALVVGSEGSGLGRLVAETCDVLVNIPMAATSVQSLNASVAGSLVLYEAFRQRSASQPA